MEAENADVEAIKEKTNTLAQAAMKLGEAMYQNPEGEGAPQDGDSAPAEDDDIVDADFEEIREDSKKSD